MVAEPPDDATYLDRVDHWREDVPDALDECYQTLLADGAVPRHAAAALHYLWAHAEGERPTQGEVADSYECSAKTLRTYSRQIRTQVASALDLSPARLPTPDPGTSDSDSAWSRTERAVLHTLRTHDEPVLDVDTLTDATMYDRGTVANAARQLHDAEVLGKRRQGKRVVYWDPDREDAPAYDSPPAVPETPAHELLEQLADARGWRSTAEADGKHEGHYAIYPERDSGTKAVIGPKGLADLTGCDTKLGTVNALITEWGLDPDEDLSLMINVNKSGLAKLIAGVDMSDSSRDP